MELHWDNLAPHYENIGGLHYWHFNRKCTLSTPGLPGATENANFMHGGVMFGAEMYCLAVFHQFLVCFVVCYVEIMSERGQRISSWWSASNGGRPPETHLLGSDSAC